MAAKVEGQASLAPVAGDEGGALPFEGLAKAARPVAFCVLDLDDVRPVGSKQSAGAGCGDALGELDHAYAGKRKIRIEIFFRHAVFASLSFVHRQTSIFAKPHFCGTPCSGVCFVVE